MATVHVFTSRYLQVAHHIYGADGRVPALTHYLNELVLCDAWFLRYRVSRLALAALMVALHTLRYPHWVSVRVLYLLPCVCGDWLMF